MPFRTQSELVFATLLWTELLGLGCAATPSATTPKLTQNDVIQVRLSMAQTMVEQNDHDRAIPYLKALLRDKLPPAYAVRARLLLGIILRDKSMHQVAQRELQAALRIAPQNADAHSAYGVLLDRMNRHAAAEKHHRKAVKLAPRVAAHRNNLGFCLFLRAKYEQAEEELREAIRFDPSMRRAFNNLGFALGLRGEREAAMDAFQQAGSLTMALTNMGVVEEMRGHPQKARQYYERALRHKSDFKPALENLRVLEPQRSPETRPKQPETGPKQKGAKL